MTELQNLYIHFPGAGGENTCDMAAFIVACKMPVAGRRECVWMETDHESPHTAHLALSGVSHLEFGEQFKPFPAHWGKPPNGTMKGHDGVVRALPGGYGKGNSPMFNWVQMHMMQDKETMTNEYGEKPYPFGNYSL